MNRFKLAVLAFAIPCIMQAQSFVSGGTAVNLNQVGGTNTVSGGVSGSLGVGGLAAAGAAQAGNPVLGGATYNTSAPTPAAGQVEPLQIDSSGNLKVVFSGALATGGNTIGNVGIVAGSALIGSVTSIPKTACSTTNFNQAWVAVPTSPTSLTATTTCVEEIAITNTNASGQTVTITDAQGTPVTIIPTISIPGNSTFLFPLSGVQATSGIKWSAGGTGVTGAVLGWQ